MATCGSNKPAAKFERLPTFAEPTHYNIHLVPNFESFTFDGLVSIDVNIKEETDVLKVHAQSLNIQNVSVKNEAGKLSDHLSTDYDDKLNILSVKLPGTFKPQKVQLNFKYVGELNDKMRGFYRSSYKDASGDEKFLASTQFESTYARFAFPCWDEPIYKSTFDVTLEVANGHTALSNMNSVSTTPSANGKSQIVKFATSPKMSSYLVAFAVGELEYISAKTKSGVEMRVYTVPGKKEQGKFSLDLSVKAIDWYNEWFDIPYPLPKCDLIAIPDFSMGAMENWGLVTYREVALLVDPKVTSTRQKSRVALVVAHELAHLWFGNLVTMKWWTDLWLKEGFASFMEYMFVGENCPEFKIWLHFVHDELASGMELDSLRNSHPIEVEIDNPNELDEIYDSITYAKSNSVNRMLCYYLSEPVFQKGLRLYLKKFQYSNAVTQDLWTALSEASGQNVNELMSGWTKQMGFPVVKVSQRQEGNNRVLTLEQKRFISDGGEDNLQSLWQVPITISTGSNPSEVKSRFVLKERKQEYTLENIGAEEWVKLNSGTTGFYRVEYSDEMLNAMLPDIANRKMPVLDRFGLINDLGALVKAGKVTLAQFVNVVAAFVHEDEYVVWAAIDEGLGKLSACSMEISPDVNARVKKLIVKIFEKTGLELGFDEKPGDDSQKMMLRAMVQSRLARAGHQPTIDKFMQMFNDYIVISTPIHPDIRLAVFGAAARNGGKDVFDKLLKLRESTAFGEIDRQCVVAMSQTQEKELLVNLFEYGFGQNKVRPQDQLYLFLGTGSSRMGREYAWEYFKQNIKAFMDKYGGSNASLFQRCLKFSGESFYSNERAQEFQDFFCNCKELNDVDRQTLNRPIGQTVESIRLNANLVEKNRQAIEELLKQHGM
ncbi:unnamed protein product [Caenorhabditis bovis]|uniref:Aminopeptidase n=1 Tax=Caenorhabditis bovis TaxID=2654633 RepID=A0A8S1FE31_9PELO|nr:unnamed protein product [Caenorhabditis bovis]